MGHPGSAHDAHAFRSTCIHKEHDTLLSQDEWIWGDSAYLLMTWLVLPFKKPWEGCLTKNQQTFNYFLSRVCVCVEHAFGALKGCFQSLQELWHSIHSTKDLQYAVNWVIFCLILHNMIIQFEEGWYGEKLVQRKELETWARTEIQVETETELAEANMNDSSPGQVFCQTFMNILLYSPSQPEEIQ
ncbi:hypothetical protein PAXRUDRAFT_168291 [Paxillus rubicundulus Ve08.2h10]|uniref:DDE Tnp4 domain-containing protein n=1 Tax=Paxillus rubicundulus Ve08.2h10 TaxID=930991 RepID=A0A0D0D0B9_9AGAM|nr:hypothetical protein PAXRUDRAFT_168291 [Paxillus rubicundulus Ve08.2h10]